MPTIIGLAAVARSGKDTVASMLLEHKDVAAYALADPLKAGCQSLFGLSDEQTWSDDIKEEVIQMWGLSPRQMFQRVGTEWLRDHNPDHWLLRADRQLNHPRPPSRLPTIDDLGSPSSSIWLAVQAIWDLSHEQTFKHNHRDTLDAFWSLTPNQMFSVLSNYLHTDFPKFSNVRSQLPTTLSTKKQLDAFGKSIFVIKDIRYENEASFWRNHNGVIWHITRNSAPKVHQHSSENGINFMPGDKLIQNDGTLDELRKKVNQAWIRVHA
ncbi:deoxynucleotide monophosphate kinase [Pseudomonas viridiflava]|uniref:deoxynucleotide monophosphate kinase family protein n=1 Tax=Pseudomonas viridiflava TaxID=33069 RepID=UPI000F0153FD|nr:deoxynucleotide monophosphate kinase [Pseudomonas viridiflava]